MERFRRLQHAPFGGRSIALAGPTHVFLSRTSLTSVEFAPDVAEVGTSLVNDAQTLIDPIPHLCKTSEPKRTGLPEGICRRRGDPESPRSRCRPSAPTPRSRRGSGSSRHPTRSTPCALAIAAAIVSASGSYLGVSLLSPSACLV